MFLQQKTRKRINVKLTWRMVRKGAVKLNLLLLKASLSENNNITINHNYSFTEPKTIS